MDSKSRSSSRKDPSLKARKDLFFDDTPIASSDSDAPRKPFKDYVRETPAAPLSPLIKAGLWAAARWWRCYSWWRCTALAGRGSRRRRIRTRRGWWRRRG